MLEKITRRLIGRFNEVFPEWRGIDIDYQWHGLICMTRRLTPAIGRFDDDPSVFFGFGYHGNGVNTATWAGKQIADWLATASETSTTKPDWLPEMVYGMPRCFPLAGLRLRYVPSSGRYVEFARQADLGKTPELRSFRPSLNYYSPLRNVGRSHSDDRDTCLPFPNHPWYGVNQATSDLLVVR